MKARASTTPAVLYARVSSKDQEREGFSIPAQRTLLREHARQHGFEVLEEFIDVETAKHVGRTQFGAMLAFLRTHRTCRDVLVEKTDRLYRNIRDWITVDDLDVTVHSSKRTRSSPSVRGPRTSSCMASKY